jgi:hypothetical protein
VTINQKSSFFRFLSGIIVTFFHVFGFLKPIAFIVIAKLSRSILLSFLVDESEILPYKTDK